jgi:hypothetical protein
MSALGQLVTDPAHDVDVREIIQLHGMSDSEMLVALLRTEAGQVTAGFGLAAGGQGEQQQDIDVLGHGKFLSNNSTTNGMISNYLVSDSIRVSPAPVKGGGDFLKPSTLDFVLQFT